MRTRRLIVVTPEGERELLFIGRLTVGRAPECDVSLADSKISRRHVEFEASGSIVRVTDLGSRNGILVNGRKVGSADLVPGDVVTVGDARIRFEERTTAPLEPAAALPAVDDLDAALPPMMASGLPAVVPDLPLNIPPDAAAPPESLGKVPVIGVTFEPERTALVPPRNPPAPAAQVAPQFDPSTERTTLLPPPQPATAAAARPVNASPVVTTAAIDAVPSVPRVSRAPSVAPAHRSVGPPPSVSPPLAEVPAVAPAAPPALAHPAATRNAPSGPRFSWGGLVTLSVVLFGGLAVLLGALPMMVALGATLVLAILVVLLIRRHTRATLQHFTRQVELAVSGASPAVMEGGLMPGLERLPGVVAHLLEQRAHGTMRARGHATDLMDTADPALVPIATPPSPAWLELTPSLTVAESSVHGPTGTAGWSDARGRHLLDVLDNGPIRNAVVQGLGTLGMQSGTEVTVPVPGAAPIVLRRGASGHVRVTIGAL